uniref:virB8 family protein n=1 Tax=Parerythrobacter lutipelagi TaxID=1964208 RepID=UPI0010F8E60A|nr:VirB8/TrbF family protein [Parerythrobacter lutipelagi]
MTFLGLGKREDGQAIDMDELSDDSTNPFGNDDEVGEQSSSSWDRSVTWELERSRRIAWIVAGVSAAIALLLALAVVMLLPLRTVEPYTILVDRQTGNVERLAPMDEQLVTPDAALTRSMLAQYVIARESFDGASIQEDYRKVGLWSAGEEQQRYSGQMQSSNPRSPLAFMPAGGRIKAEIISVSSLAPGQMMVRFITTRTDPGAREQQKQYWAAIINYEFSGAGMSEDDRLLNPLGFQVTRYRRDAETMPEFEQQAETAAPPSRTREASDNSAAEDGKSDE